MGESWDPDLVRQAAGVEGYEARFITQTPKYDRQMLMLWGPQADLARDPRWGRSEEVYGEDPFFNGTMATAFVKGLQGDDPKYWQSAALLKHFLANSNENLRTKSNSEFDQRLFWEYYSVPFRMGFVDGGAKAVMASYNAWNGTPMAVNPILKSIVEDQWGVDVLSSDGGAVRLLVPTTSASRPQTSRRRLSQGGHQSVSRQICRRNQSCVEGWLDYGERDRRAARPKFRIADQARFARSAVDGAVLDDKGLARAVEHRQGQQVSQKLALESVVLLKNANSFLPLKKDSIKSIAVIGPLADSVHWDWYGGTPPYAITPLQGIKDEVGPT